MRPLQLTICESRPVGALHWVAFADQMLAQLWRPGQYIQLLCDHQHIPGHLLMRAFFPAQVDTRLGRVGVLFAPQHDEALQWLAHRGIGTHVQGTGPHGKMPQPIPSRGTALCIGQHEGAIRLLGLVNHLHQQHTSVTFVAGDLPTSEYLPTQLIPADVEYLAGTENVLRVMERRTTELLRWADHIYVSAHAPVVGAIQQLLRQSRLRAGRAITSVNLVTPLPCVTQSCRQCQIHTRKGPRLACQSGPWLDIHDLGS